MSFIRLKTLLCMQWSPEIASLSTRYIHPSTGVTRGMYLDLNLALGGVWECNLSHMIESLGGHQTIGTWLSSYD